MNKKTNPLLIVSSLQPQQLPINTYLQKKNFLTIEPQHLSKRRSIQEKKFIIKPINSNVKYRTINLDQRQISSLSIRNSTQKNFRKSVILPNNYPANNLEFIIGAINKQLRQSKTAGKGRTSTRRYSYQVKKEDNSTDFIRKSLLQPCQISSVNMSQRNKTSTCHKFHSPTKVGNFAVRKKFRNPVKLIPYSIQPWNSQILEGQQNIF